MTGLGIDAPLPPAGDVDAEEFWAALDRGELLVAVCESCGKHFLPPLATCPRCGSRAVTLQPAPTRARLYTWTVIHQAVDPAFRDDAPYVIGLAELADGTRLYGRVVGVEHDDLRDGLDLHVGVATVGTRHIWYFGLPS
jgi:uncharacterized OB-fold protein